MRTNTNPNFKLSKLQLAVAATMFAASGSTFAALTCAPTHAIAQIGGQAITLDCLGTGDFSNPSGTTINNTVAGGVTIQIGFITSIGPLVYSNGTIGTFTNDGTISNTGTIGANPTNGIDILNGSTITSLINNGTISSNVNTGLYVRDGAVLSSLYNSNSGLISGYFGLVLSNSTPTTVQNFGSIIGTTSYTPVVISNAHGVDFYNFGNVTNTGNTKGLQGLSFTTMSLTNLQGAGNTNGPLNYLGKLPTTYNVVINSSSQYGQLNVTTPTGTMAFNIYGNAGSTLVSGALASTLAVNRYVNVLQGFSTLSSVTGTTGTYGSYNYSLVAGTGVGNWDLDVTSNGGGGGSGPSAADTQDALKQSAAALRSVFNYQSALVNNSLNYDCTVFAENGVCVSGGGRFAMTNNITGEQMSSLLVGSYKAKPNMRVGAFIDQNASTPSAAGISVDKSPMYGVFGVWNQNTDLSGYEVRLSSSWSDQNITQTRNVVGTSEAGVGTAGLKSQAMSGVVSYAMALPETSWIASPYVGVRKTKVSRGGYTETSAVTTPLTYSDLNQDITTALAGVRMSKKYGNDFYVTASAGVEQNIGSNISTLDASGVTGLTATDFSANYAKTRPVASVGMSYAVAKDQRISFSAMYRKEAFQSAGSTTGLLMYQVGL